MRKILRMKKHTLALVWLQFWSHCLRGFCEGKKALFWGSVAELFSDRDRQTKSSQEPIRARASVLSVDRDQFNQNLNHIEQQKVFPENDKFNTSWDMGWLDSCWFVEWSPTRVRRRYTPSIHTWFKTASNPLQRYHSMHARGEKVEDVLKTQKPENEKFGHLVHVSRSYY